MLNLKVFTFCHCSKKWYRRQATKTEEYEKKWLEVVLQSVSNHFDTDTMTNLLFFRVDDYLLVPMKLSKSHIAL